MLKRKATFTAQKRRNSGKLLFLFSITTRALIWINKSSWVINYISIALFLQLIILCQFFHLIRTSDIWYNMNHLSRDIKLGFYEEHISKWEQRNCKINSKSGNTEIYCRWSIRLSYFVYNAWHHLLNRTKLSITAWNYSYQCTCFRRDCDCFRLTRWFVTEICNRIQF